MRKTRRRTFLVSAAYIAASLFSGAAHAEVRVIEAGAVCAAGGNIGMPEARRIAALDARRNALERAASSVADGPPLKGLRLTKEEATAYAAGVLETEILPEKSSDAADRTPVTVTIRARIDTDVLGRQIERYSDSDEFLEQLVASQRKNDRLRKDRDALLKRLAATTDRHTIERSRKQLDQFLIREETGNEVLRIWSRYGRDIDFFGPAKLTPAPGNGELDTAIADLERAVSVVPGNPRAHLILAALYETKGDDAMAEKRLMAAVKANPTMPLFHMELGFFYSLRERHEEALRHFLASERLRPREPLVLFHIGAAYKHLDQCRQAVVNFRRFLGMSGNRSSPRFAAMNRDAEEVIRDCEGKPRGPGSRQRPLRKAR